MRSHGGPEDVKKIQSSIIRKFLRGEISKDQAQKLDN